MRGRILLQAVGRDSTLLRTAGGDLLLHQVTVANALLHAEQSEGLKGATHP